MLADEHQVPAYIRPTLLQLFLAFLKLGATAFGGPAMVAIIRRLAVQTKRWLDDDTFRNGVALCQTIPGATAMQTSAYVGLRTRGIKGAAVSFIGFGLPGLVLMLVLSALYARLQGVPTALTIFSGLRALVVALIAHAAVTFGRTYLTKWHDYIVASLAALLFWIGLSPVLVIVLSFLMGVGVRFRGDGPNRERRPPVEPFPVKFVVLVVVVAASSLAALLLIDRRLFELSVLMLRIDVFAFGGGFASLSLMFHEFVGVRHWLEPRTFMDGIALGQVTPGPIVITATFVGYAVRGILGALIATASIFFPSFVLVTSITPIFLRLNSFMLFRKGVDGVLCSFVGLLASTAARFGTSVAWDLPRAAIAAAVFAALMLRLNLLWIVVGVAILSLLIG